MSPRPPGTIDPLTYAAYGDRQGTLANEKAWLRSWTDETYLWYQDLEALSPSVLDPDGYASATAYFKALRSPLVTASGKQKDAYHYAESSVDYATGAAGGAAFDYGWLLSLSSSLPPRTETVVTVTPGSQAADAGLVRGEQIVSIDGVDAVNDETMSGVATLNAGLSPTSTTPHVFGVLDPVTGVQRTVTLTPSSMIVSPVPRVATLPAPNQSVGYIEFDAHIATAEALLVDAFTQLKASGVTDLVLDMRYNRGGYLTLASELAYMVAGPTATNGKAFAQLIYNDKNPFQVTAAQATRPFRSTGNGDSVPTGDVLPTLGLSRVFVLTTVDTCSASETVINGLRGAGVQVVLIGATTCGKPYGFIPKDNCGTTYLTIQFRSVNALGFGDYADGFTPDCEVADDYTHDLGDPAEALLAVALGRQSGSGASCMAQSTAARRKAQAAAARRNADGPTLGRPSWRDNTILTLH